MKVTLKQRIRTWRPRGGGRPPDEPDYSDEVWAILNAPVPEEDVEDPKPWPSDLGNEKPVLLVPAADYHLEELIPLSEELEKRGIPTVFAVGRSPWERTRRGLPNYPKLEIFWLPTPDEVARDIRLVVTLKDTGSMTDWVPEVRALGVPVIGKVEGAQDFWDADTLEKRRPYRNFDLVLCQGEFDADALTDVSTAIVGSSRLERLWKAVPAKPPETPLALINLNFVYGVRTYDRDLWLETAIAGCEKAGIEHLVTVHPAERSNIAGPRITRVSALELIPHSSVLVSRFSTVPFEAMAQGVPFIYHNPHGENVSTFKDPRGGFPETSSQQSLSAAIGKPPSGREGTTAFIHRHISITEAPSDRRAADVILEAFE